MEQPPRRVRDRPVWVFAGGLAAFFIVLNAVLIGAAREDRSFLAGWLAFLVGPLLNATLGATSCLVVPNFRRIDPSCSSDTYFGVAMLLSILGTVVCFSAIMSLDLHGC